MRGTWVLPAFWLFAIVFFWTPPHFWALALLLREQYAAAKVPMLPVVRGERETVRQILGYTVVLLVASVIPFAIGSFGAVYLLGALVLGAVFLGLAVRLARGDDPTRRSAPLPLLACSTWRCSSWSRLSIYRFESVTLGRR